MISLATAYVTQIEHEIIHVLGHLDSSQYIINTQGGF